MKLSAGLWQTYKEAPQDAEIASHKLMARARLIHKSSSGLYNLLPMGLRCVQKIKQIIRQEHDKEGFLELAMSVATPGELWKETGRWDKMGDLMVKFEDKGGRDLCLSPTNEEAVVDIFRKSVKSYKQLPITVYQINTKFRDEIRPRYGLIRCREFIMKDAYSFVLDAKGQDAIYQKFYNLYSRIFSQMGLKFIVVEADAGAIGSANSKTHEFQVVATAGEDEIICCETEKYAANIEKAETKRKTSNFHYTEDALKKVDTKDKKTIESVCQFLKIPQHQSLKALIYTAITGKKTEHIAIFILGDDLLNEVKLKNFLHAEKVFPTSKEDMGKFKLPMGSIGPLGLKKMRIIFDSAIDLEAAYTVGANKKAAHFQNYIPRRDSKDLATADLRMSKEGDICLKTNGKAVIKRGIEVGHIFQLGDIYTKSMNALVQNKEGQFVAPLMGCYGIGVTRIVAACIEQNHDSNGILWPKALAPYHVYFGVITKDPKLQKLAYDLYQKLWDNQIETVLDDRGYPPGHMFKDSDLLGLPLRVVLGERDFKRDGTLEIKARKTQKSWRATPEELVGQIETILQGL